MGVHGLWQLLQPSGRPVTLESLEGKVLAVDVSIWLHQTMKGMRDKDGNPLPNAHLQGLFSRVCKLLFYRIKPVFVFDGGVPALKKSTLAARRERKSEAQRESSEIAQKLLRNLLKSQAVKNTLGGADKDVRVPGVRRKGGEKDIFELAPLPESEAIGLTLNSEAWETEFEQQESWVQEGLATLSKVDPDSEEFKSLPMEIQHEALVDLKEERKFHSLSRISKMPEDADSFSAYQLKKLMKVSNLTTRIDDVRKQMSNRTTGELCYELGEDYYGDEVEARRIVSEDASHYILIKGMTKQKQREEAEKYVLERTIKVEKEDDEKNLARESTRIKQSEKNMSENLVEEKGNVGSSSRRLSHGKDGDVRCKRLEDNEERPRKGRRTWRKRLPVASAISSDEEDVKGDDKDNESVDENHDVEASSSEDEGFIEVTFDPSQVVAEEDDLFPASIFTTTSEPQHGDLSSTNHKSGLSPDVSVNFERETRKGKNDFEKLVIKKEGSKKGKKVLIRDSDTDSDSAKTSEKELSTVQKGKENFKKMATERKDCRKESKDLLCDDTDPNSPQEGEKSHSSSLRQDKAVVATPDMTEKRKGVLSDVLLELQKKKEALLTLTAADDNVDEELKEKDDLDVRDDDGEEMDVEGQLPGGFLRDGQESEDESGFDKKIFRKRGGSLDEKMKDDMLVRIKEEESDDESENVVDNEDAEMMLHEGRHDSEDEDLRLAIELSLQTAREEQEMAEEEVGEESRSARSDGPSHASKSRNLINDESDEDDDDDDFEMVESIENEEDVDVIPDTSVKELYNGEIQTMGVDDDGVCNVSSQNSESAGKSMDIANVAKDDDSPHNASKPSCSNDDVSPSQQGKERLQPEDVDDPFLAFTTSNLGHIHDALESERAGLLSEQGKQNRFASSVTEQVVMEAQELLNLFGIPFLVSPMEAEAQCAFLDITQQTQGTITDDSDIWLFGGTRVFKNFFNQSKLVEYFTMDLIQSHFSLSREQLINIALLCGSDYTTGIQGVGPVRALEIMGEFPGDGLAGLQAFRKWWDRSQKHPVIPGESKLKTRLRDLSLDNGFPRPEVLEAYLAPSVDESRERFSWGEPNLDLLRQFAKVKFGWTKDKSNSVLEPMMKQFLLTKTQGRIYSYFQPGTFIPAHTIQSERLKKALSIVQRSSKSQNTSGNINDEDGGAEEEENVEVRHVSKPKVINKKSGKVIPEKNKMGNAAKKNMKTHRGNQRKGDEDSDTDLENDGSKVKANSVKNRKGVKNKKVQKKKEMEDKEVSSSSKHIGSDYLDIEIKKEKDVDDTFMKHMQEKVAAASSLLGKSDVTKKDGRGRGRGGQGQQRKRGTAVLSLEVKNRRGKVQSGQRGRSMKSAMNRSIVCLSESSSSSDGDDDDDDDDGEAYGGGFDHEGKDIESLSELKGRSTSQYSDTKNTSVSKKKVAQTKRPKVEQTREVPKETQSSNDKAVPQSKLNKAKKPVDCCELEKQKSETESDYTETTKSSQRFLTSTKVTDKKVTFKEDETKSVEKRVHSVQQEVASRKGRNKEKSVQGQGKETTMNEDQGKSTENLLLTEEGLSKTSDNLSRAKSEGSKTKEDLGQSQATDGESKTTEEKELVCQAPGKNPDVSLINAITLKSTLSYLNQRSGSEKHLLNALGGKRPSNAIERRLEEEERREKRIALDSMKKNEVKKKEVKKKEIKDNKKPEPKLSFEDMLSGGELIQTTKSTSNAVTLKKKRELGNKTVSSEVATKSRKIDKDNIVDITSQENEKEKYSKPTEKHRRLRMRSLSDDSEIDTTSSSSGVVDKDRKEKVSQGGDHKVVKSQKSQAFDAPIGVPDGGDLRQEKFKLQINHFREFQSVKGHGIIPPQVSRGRAIAGKGKGIGKNRNGRQQQPQADGKAGGAGGASAVVTGVMASSGVTDAEIMEYGCMTLDDLGSDFSDNDF